MSKTNSIRLHLWVNNQPEGQNFDATSCYLRAANWVAPSGVTLDDESQAISGDAEATWAAFRSLAKAVAEAGHGEDCEDEPAPVLTACPVELIEDGYTCAGESLARLNSSECATWVAFVASVPSLAETLAEAATLREMAEMLNRYGDKFAGNHAKDIAQDWLDNGFDAADAGEWCEIGVWDAATAAEFRDAELSPAQVVAASESLTDGLDDPAEEYTDGDPIYAACNNDISARVIIDAAKS